MQTENDKRTEGRSNVFLAAALDCGASSVPVRIRNISPKGALVEGASFPPIGAAVRLLRGSLTAAGTLAWQANQHAGINFDGRIDVQSWVRGAGHSGQQRVDGIVAAIRRSEPVEEPPYAPPSASLHSVSAALDELCGRLASSDKFPVELGEELMKLEVIAQSLRDLARRSG
jgi:hypothetical protein